MPNNVPDIESLLKRYRTLYDTKIRGEQDLENATRELQRLQEQARTEFGTDDVDVLKKRLDEMEEENVLKRAEYDKHLSDLESKLADIEQESQDSQ